MALNVEQAAKSPGGLEKTQVARPHPQRFLFSVSRVEPTFAFPASPQVV